MAIRIPQLGLAIYTSPKVLSTSLKHLAFELENGRAFEEFTIAGRPIFVHRFYPAKPFEPVNRNEYPHVIAFVRDPVKRFVSMFRNRVARIPLLSATNWRKAAEEGLSESPSFSEFIARFDDYVALINDVRHHAGLQVEFLGNDPSFFDRIFTDESLPEFERFIEELGGKPASIPWDQKSNSQIPVSLDKKNLAWIGERYRLDYETFGDYFSSMTKSKPASWRGGQGKA